MESKRPNRSGLPDPQKIRRNQILQVHNHQQVAVLSNLRNGELSGKVFVRKLDWLVEATVEVEAVAVLTQVKLCAARLPEQVYHREQRPSLLLIQLLVFQSKGNTFYFSYQAVFTYTTVLSVIININILLPPIVVQAP